MSDENEKLEQEDFEEQEMDIDMVPFLDDFALNRVDLTNHPISNMFKDNAKRIISKYHASKEKSVHELRKKKQEYENKFSNETDVHERSNLSSKMRGIDSKIDNIETMYQLHKDRTNFECEINWRYYLAKTFLETREKFLSNLFEKDASEVNGNGTFH